MDRFTISLDESLAEGFDLLIRSRSYGNRSEAVRDLLRREIEADRLAREDAPHCVANLSYVYNHHERRLAERLADLQHHAHGLVVSTMHVHLDHDHCLETLFLRGHTAAVRQLADKLAAESGVRHSSLNLVPVTVEEHDQTHWHARPHT
jgi:CopG family nickel-responsive transcriptional regulator